MDTDTVTGGEIRSIRDLRTRSRSHESSAFHASQLAGECLYSLQRQPHKYGYSFLAIGTAPHLSAFEGTPFAQAQRADGFDLFDPGLATVKCVHELLERVWSPDPGADLSEPVPLSGIGGKAANPRDFAMLSDREREHLDEPFQPYTDTTPLRWRPGWRITGADGGIVPAQLPAVLVHPGFGYLYPEDRICPMLSLGLAAGRSPEDAVMRGLYEVIERDAAAAGWLAGIPARRVDVEFIGAAAADHLKALWSDGFDIELFDITLDIPVPVYLSVIRNDRREEPFAAALGLGCNLDPSTAARKAFAESLFVMQASFEFPGGADAARLPADPARRFGPDDLRVALDRLSAAAVDGKSNRSGDPVDGETELGIALQRVLERGHDICIADLTPIGSEGFALFRVLVSNLQPMLYEVTARRLANPRLYDLPRRLGLRADEISEADLDLSPHPFTHHEMP